MCRTDRDPAHSPDDTCPTCRADIVRLVDGAKTEVGEMSGNATLSVKTGLASGSVSPRSNAPTDDPICPECGKPAGVHWRVERIEGMGWFSAQGEPPCELSAFAVLRLALREAREKAAFDVEVWRSKARLYGEDATNARRDCDALRDEVERLTGHIKTALTVLKASDHDADDDELYDAWRENRYGGCTECIAAFVLRFALTPPTGGTPDVR